MNKKLTIGLALAVILALVASVAALADSVPTISSDQPDYWPGSTVTLNGAGWPGDDVVHVFVNDSVGSSWSYGYDATAAADGTFTFAFQLPNWFVATYYVTATGASGAVASITFTDAQPAHLNFAADVTCPVGVEVTDYVNSGGNHKSQTGTTPMALDVSANTTVTFSYAPSVVCAGVTYNFLSSSPASGFTSGSANSNTTISAHYVVAVAGTTLTVAAATGTYGGTVNLAATLTKTSDSSAVSGETISFTLNGSGVGAATTDGSGVATLNSVSLTGINAGNYPSGVAASFAGDTNYGSSSGTNSLTVNKATPTLSVTNSPVTYNGSSQSATVGHSVAGTFSNVKYNGSSTVPTNAGTYAVTADFAPTDTTNYSALTGASAGNFVINKADAKCTISGYTGTYDATAHGPVAHA